MDDIVNVQDAKTRLSELLHRVEKGRSVTIARAGRPIAQLRPVGDRVRRFGFMSFDVPDDFDAPLDADELARWE